MAETEAKSSMVSLDPRKALSFMLVGNGQVNEKMNTFDSPIKRIDQIPKITVKHIMAATSSMQVFELTS